MRRRWASDIGLYIEGWVMSGKGSTCGCHLVRSAYAEVISPEFFNTIRASLFILIGTCMELVEEDLIVPRGCWVQNI